jgi:hypothetical protein
MTNKDVYYTNMSSNFSMSRSKFQSFRIILITSLFWVLLDAFLIFYLTDCGTNNFRDSALACERQLESVQRQLVQLQKDHAKIVKNLPQQDDDEEKQVADAQKHEVDYDAELRAKNKRLHDVHKIKNQELITPETKNSGILNKIQDWFKEDHSAEPTNPPFWPGENGRGVVIPENLKKESEKRFKENQFNIVASDLIALNRSVPDQRSES